MSRYISRHGIATCVAIVLTVLVIDLIVWAGVAR